MVVHLQRTRFLPTAGLRCMVDALLPPLAGRPSWLARRPSPSWGHPCLASGHSTRDMDIPAVSERLVR